MYYNFDVADAKKASPLVIAEVTSSLQRLQARHFPSLKDISPTIKAFTKELDAVFA